MCLLNLVLNCTNKLHLDYFYYLDTSLHKPGLNKMYGIFNITYYSQVQYLHITHTHLFCGMHNNFIYILCN